jgi:hypothetical protein
VRRQGAGARLHRRAGLVRSVVKTSWLNNL